MNTIILLSAWYCIGVVSFCYWWTEDNDLNSGDLLFSFFVGVLGPIAWLIGWMVHSPKKTVFKQRSRK